MRPTRRGSFLIAATGLLAASALTGAAAESTGSWNLASRISPNAGWVTAAQAGDLQLQLRRSGPTVLASVDPADVSAQQPLENLGAGQAVIAWTAPLTGGGQELVGIARSDVEAVTVVLSDETTTTLPLDYLDGFSYTSERAQITDILALDATGATIGEITVPPTGPTCEQNVCRDLTGPTALSGTGTAVPLYGIYSQPVASEPAAETHPKLGGSSPVAVNPHTGAVFYGTGSTLRRIDPVTFRPHGKALKLPIEFQPQAFSPDRSHLLGTNFAQSLTLVNLTTLSLNRKLQPRLTADLGPNIARASAWLTPDRILVLAQTMGAPRYSNVASRTLLAINPENGAVVWRRSLTNKLSFITSRTVGRKLVLLLSADHERRIAVVVATADGQIHTTSLRPTDRNFAEQLVITADASPAAYIVGAANTVFSIDLDTGRAGTHRITAPRNAPNAAAITPGGNHADSLGEKIVASGDVFPLANGSARKGLYLIDPATWKAQLITTANDNFVSNRNDLIAYSTTPLIEMLARHPSGHGSGITIYDQNGRPVHHLFGTDRFLGITTTPTLAFAITFAPLPTRSRGRAGVYFVSFAGARLLFDPATGKPIGKTAATGSPRLIYPGQRLT